MIDSDPNLRRLVSSGSFRVDVDGPGGPWSGSFSACSGLEGACGHLSVREGGVEAARLFRAEVSWHPIRLERGFAAGGGELWSWFQAGDPRNGSIVLLASDGEEAARWSFERGRPAAWAAPRLDAEREGVAVERIEIVHEGLRWVNP